MTKKQIDGKWKKLESALIPYTDSPRETIECIRELYALYDRSILTWLVGLFDKDIGGFYYSNSARDGDTFLPDIESTGQGVALLEVTGAISGYDDIPEWMRSRIASFICSCEDQESGYFYNPQWSKEMTDAKPPRRARDTHWAIDLAEMCNFDIANPTAFSKIRSGDTSKMRFLESEEAFCDYLNSLDWNKCLISSMDVIVNICDEIISAGLGDACIEFINSMRDPESGVWGVGRVNEREQLKITSGVLWFYSSLGITVSEPMKIFEFALKSFEQDDFCGISFTCARWTVIRLLLKILAEYGGREEVRLVREMVGRIVEQLPRLIPITVKALSRFKHPDGSFSWSDTGSAATSHSMPVAMENAFEGDINATILAASVAKKLVGIITLSDDFVPLFSNEDMIAFEQAVRG